MTLDSGCLTHMGTCRCTTSGETFLTSVLMRRDCLRSGLPFDVHVWITDHEQAHSGI